MHFYHYILLAVIVGFFLCMTNAHTEAFESLTNCLEQGYPDDFCLRSPVQACVTNCPAGGTFKAKTFATFSS